jgi:hypothetical protein
MNKAAFQFGATIFLYDSVKIKSGVNQVGCYNIALVNSVTVNIAY